MYKIFFVLMLLSMIINDLPFQGEMGTLSASPMFIVSFVVFLVIIFNKRFIYLSTLDKVFFKYFIVTFFVSFAFVYYEFFINGILYNPYGSNIILKLLTASSYNLVFFLLVYSLSNILNRISDEFAYFSIKLIFVILFVIGVFQYFNIYDFSVFHYREVSLDRLKLLSPEPSMAAFIVNIFGLLSLVRIKNHYIKILFLLMLLFLNLQIGSKVSILYLSISIVLYTIFSLKSFKKKIIFCALLIISAPLLYYYFSFVIFPEFKTDFYQFTSFSTRLTTVVWTVLSAIKYPLGEGYGTYMNYAPELLRDSMDILSSYFNNGLNFTEIYIMIGSGYSLSAKSGIMSQIIYNGFIAVIFFMFIFNDMAKKINNHNDHYESAVYKIILYYMILSLLLSVNIELMYVYVLPLVLISKNYYKI